MNKIIKSKYVFGFAIGILVICGLVIGISFLSGSASKVLSLKTDHKLAQDRLTWEQQYNLYTGLQTAAIAPATLISQMQANKGLYDGDPNSIQAARYYAFKGDEKVIKQLIKNLESEVTVTLRDRNGSIIESINIQGKSFDILSHGWWPHCEQWNDLCDSGKPLISAVVPLLHEELHRLAAQEKLNEQQIYILFKLVEKNEPRVKEFNVKGRPNPVYEYGNTEWYTGELVHKDVRAYLRIMSEANHPSLKYTSAQHLIYFPGLWLRSVNLSKILTLAEEKGFLEAFHAIEPALKPIILQPTEDALESVSKESVIQKEVPFLCSTQSIAAGYWEPSVYTQDKKISGDMLGYSYDFFSLYCTKCLSIRLSNVQNFTTRLISFRESGMSECDHYWVGGTHSWSKDTIGVGDFLAIASDNSLYIIKVNELQRNGTGYSIAHEPFVGIKENNNKLVLEELNWQETIGKSGFSVANRLVPFRINESNGNLKLRVAYDNYYGGLESALFPERSLLIAIIHTEDIQDSNVQLNYFRFKGWEDGLGNRCRAYERKVNK